MLKENSKLVFNFVKAHEGENIESDNPLSH